ncbi:MAG: hypothetical protein ACMXYL_03890 [Candidatus Woesearchaeota archaeon]
MKGVVIGLGQGYYYCHVRNNKIQTKEARRAASMKEAITVGGNGKDIGLLSPLGTEYESELEGYNTSFIAIINFSHNKYDDAMRARAKLLQSNYHAESKAILKKIEKSIVSYNDPAEQIIKSAMLIEDLTRAKSMISNRFRNMLSSYYPQPSKEIDDSVSLARIFLDNKESFEKTPYAREIGSEEYTLLKRTAAEITGLEKLITESSEIIGKLLREHYPAFTLIATEKIASRILRETGSMKEAAFIPASKLQIIGAEKALFRHLRNNKNLPPKHGIIHEHPLMQSIPAYNKGKAARLIADKMTIAARLDYFNNNEKDIAKGLLSDLEHKINMLKKKREYEK